MASGEGVDRQGDILSKDDDEVTTTRKPVLEKALRPCLFLMKFSGLYTTCEPTKLSYLWKAYMYIVNLLMLADFIGVVRVFWHAREINDYYMATIVSIYCIKANIQAFVLLHLSHCGNKVLEFIKSLDDFLLTNVRLSNCKEMERKFTRKSWCNFAIYVVGIVLLSSLLIATAILPNSVKSEMIYKRMAEAWDSLMVIKTVADIYVLIAWISPTTLLIVLINALTYAFEEFYRYLETMKNVAANKSFLYEVRTKYIKISKLCEQFDDMMSMLLMISYLIDIVMVCLILRVATFKLNGWYLRMAAIAWLFLPLFSLISLSRQASRLYDTGQMMRTHIQQLNTMNKLDLGCKNEIDLLMFHMSGEHVVITIWKMIPLNRSIIVSIFVSIITYFAMLLSFK